MTGRAPRALAERGAPRPPVGVGRAAAVGAADPAYGAGLAPAGRRVAPRACCPAVGTRGRAARDCGSAGRTAERRPAGATLPTSCPARTMCRRTQVVVPGSPAADQTRTRSTAVPRSWPGAGRVWGRSARMAVPRSWPGVERVWGRSARMAVPRSWAGVERAWGRSTAVPRSRVAADQARARSARAGPGGSMRSAAGRRRYGPRSCRDASPCGASPDARRPGGPLRGSGS